MTALSDWLESDTAGTISLVMVVLCSIITFQNVVMHLMNYSRDDLQRHITRIILVVPIYAISSYLQLVLPGSAMIALAVVDFWEALVIYSFFNLILEYVGGEHNWLVCVQHTHPEGLKHMVPVKWLFPTRMILDPQWLRNCKLACFQFVFVKPLSVLVFLPFLLAGTYHDPPGPLIRAIIYNITYSVALYALALLYLTTHDHPSLKPKRPLVKFATVKLVIFFTYWQQYLLMFFSLTEEEMTDLLAFLTIIEMTLIAIPINWLAFPWREFQSGLLDTSDMAEMIEGGNQSPSEKLKAGVVKLNHVVNNAMKIFSPEDMVETANQNFRSKYKTHVLLESSQEYVIEENPTAEDSSPASEKSKKKKRVFKARTYLIGGLDGISPSSASQESSPGQDSSPRSNVEEPPAPASAPVTIGQQRLETLVEESSSQSHSPKYTNQVVPLLPLPPRARNVPSPSSKQTPQYTILDEDLEDEK